MMYRTYTTILASLAGRTKSRKKDTFTAHQQLWINTTSTKTVQMILSLPCPGFVFTSWKLLG